MGKMIVVGGFKAFRGKMKVSYPIFYGEVDPRDCYEVIEGDWLYMPDPDCWYCRGRSFPAQFCEVLKVE